MKTANQLLYFSLLIASLGLTACGGGSSGSNEQPAQTPAPTNTDNNTDNNTGNDSNSDNNSTDDNNAGGNELDPTSSTAKYKVKFTATWTDTFGTVPGSAHFTTLAGSAVTNESELWRSGSKASAGFEVLAETGGVSGFVDEIKAEVTANKALKSDTWAGTDAEGDSELTFEFTRDVFHYFTFATMVAPSPDWFVGTSRYNLKTAEGKWRESAIVELRVYDAGTENGNGFSLSNPATSPQGNITRLNETIANGTKFVDGLVDGKAIATVTFTRVE